LDSIAWIHCDRFLLEIMATLICLLSLFEYLNGISHTGDNCVVDVLRDDIERCTWTSVEVVEVMGIRLMMTLLGGKIDVDETELWPHMSIGGILNCWVD